MRKRIDEINAAKAAQAVSEPARVVAVENEVKGQISTGLFELSSADIDALKNWADEILSQEEKLMESVLNTKDLATI